MAFNNPLGKFRPVKIKKPGYAQPGPVHTRPNVDVRQDRPATSPPGSNNPAGGQGPVQVVQPPMGPDESWKDSVYNQTHSNIQTGLTNLSGYLLNQGNTLGNEYGIEFDRDPNNPLQASNFRINENVDVTNPFSRAALLVRTHNQNVRGNTNSMAARGQLYSGALQNAQNAEAFNYEGGKDSLIKDFSGRFGGLYRQWQEGQTTAGQADIDAIADAQERHKNDPAVGTGFVTGGAAAPGTNPNQYPDQPQGKPPKEHVTKAVQKYLAKQKKPAKPGKSDKNKSAKKSGGAQAPGR